MKNTFKKLLSLVLALVMVAGFFPPVQKAAAAGITEQTEQASDLLASATFSSSAWDWSGSGQFSYDSNSTVTNGENSLRSWRFSSTAQSVNSYSRLQLNLNKSYDMTNKDLVFDVKADPASELRSYYVGIVPINSSWEFLHDNTNYKEYQVHFTGNQWQTVTIDNATLKAYLLEGKDLSSVQLLYLSFLFPNGQAQNIYIDNMRLVDHQYGTEATDAASDILKNASVVENTANGSTYFYEHNDTSVAYGNQSISSHKFSAAAGASDTMRVKYDLGKSYDLTNKNLVMDMLAYRGTNSYIVTLYNSQNQQVSYNVGLTTQNYWSEIRPAILANKTAGMNLSDVRYIAVTARFLDNADRADRALYIDNVRIEDIDVHYTALQNKNMVFIGDSITNSYGYKGWSGELQEHYLINRYNIGVGGTSYASVAGRTRIYEQVSKIPNVDVDFFVLNGGVNDIWSNVADLGSVSSVSVENATVNSFDTNTTIGSMEQIFCYLRKNYPNAQIAFVINYICYSSDWNGVRFRDEFVPLAKAVCDKWDVPYLDLVNNESFNSQFNALHGVHTYDGVHGNDLGYELVMRQMAPWLISLCDGTEQTEQNSDRLAYASLENGTDNWSGTGTLSYNNHCTDTYGNESIRSWKFTASAGQTSNASALLNLSQMERFNLNGKAIAFDVKFEGANQKIGLQLYDSEWQALGKEVVWITGNGTSGWQTVTFDAALFDNVLIAGKDLSDVGLVSFAFDFAENAGNAKSVIIDNFRIVGSATEDTEKTSDLLYGASFVEGSFSNVGFGYDQKNTSFVNGNDSKYSLRFFAADNKTAWATAKFRLPQSVDLTNSTLQFDVLQRNQKALNVDLYDSNNNLITSDSYILRELGWQTFEINTLFGFASGKNAENLKDIRYIKFSMSFETADVGRTVVIDNLTTYENAQYETMISGMTGLYLGDSISEAIGYKGWAGEMAEHYGVNGYNVSVSGATLAKNDIFSQLAKAPTNVDFDFVMLNGGVNDVWRNITLGEVTPEGTTVFDTNTAIGALEHLFATIKSTYPNAEVMYILNYVCVQNGYPGYNFRNNFAPLAREACEKWDVHCLDLVDNDVFNAEFDATAGVHTYDGVHPNTAGYNVLTKYITQWVEDTFCVDAKVRYQQLSLSDDLTMHFDLLVSEAYKETATVTVTVDGNTVVDNVLFNQLSSGTSGCKRVSVKLAAAQMTDSIVVMIQNGDTVLFEETYSIRDYAQYLLSGDYNKKTKDLATAVLHYGADAQLYFEHNIENLANAGLDAVETVEIETLDTSNMVSGGVSGIHFYGASLLYQSKIAVRFYFTGVNIGNYTFTTVDGTSYTPVAKDGRYYVEISGINPQDYGKEIVLTVSDGATEMQVTYSPMYYISRMYHKTTDASLKKLLNSMYRYHLSAVKYLFEDVIRGEFITGGVNYSFNVPTEEKLETVSFDYKLTGGQEFDIALLTDWNNFYGYFTFAARGATGNYAGVTTEKLDDEYIRVTFNFAELTQIMGTPTPIIDQLFIRGTYSDAEGYIDNVQYTVDDGNEDGGGDEPGDDNDDGEGIVTPGADFAAAENKIISFTEGTYDVITFDYKFTSGTKLWFCIGDSTVSKFYGLFKLDGNGIGETYQGISSEVLDNGYIRVTMDIALINRTNHAWNTDNAPATVSTFFIRGDWSDAVGTIDHIRCLTNSDIEDGDDEGGSDESYTELVTPGGSFEANKGITVNFEAGAYDVVTFDYKITNGGEMQVCLLSADWQKFYGYFKFNANGATMEYDGLTTEKLDNGYVCVTMVLADLNRTNLADNRDNAPETVGILYVRGDWSSAAGTIDNVRCLTGNVVDDGGEDGTEDKYTEIVTPGDSFAAGTGLTLYFEEGTYDVVTFDYKFTSGTKMWFGLLQADWSKFYGLFNANATGMNDTYTGISTENLSNGYIRVTLNLAELTRTNSANDANNAPETISMFFIRGDWSDAAGVIDNVRCLKLNEGSNEGDNEENDDLVKEFAGASFASGETKKISFDEGAYNTITLDYKLTSGTKLWFCIGNSGLTKYYGYFKLDANGVAETYDGVSYEKLSNGYIRVTLNLAELNRTNHEWNTNNAPEMVSCIYLRGGWNDSVGTIDNIRCLVAGSGNGGGAVEDVVRGEILTAGLDKQFNFDAKDYEALSFEYKIGSGEHFWMNLVSPDWAKYYGNYKFTATGEAEDYPGVTTEKLSDNYIRVTMLMVELTKTNNQPNLSNIPATFDKLYVRGDTNTAKGYIDNLQLFEKGSMIYDYTAGTDKTVHCREGMYDQISFNYTAESGKVLYIAVKNPSGDKYYGSFGFNANGEIQNYAGIATTVLADGAVNVVINLEELNRTGNADNLNLQPVTVNGLYILGNNTTSSGELSNVIFTETVDDTVYRGVPMLAGGDLTLDIGTGVYSQVSFEYIITNDSDFHVCFIGEDWSHFYGYFNFDADGAVLNYPGVFTEKLEDGYVRVTLDIDALTKTNNQENLDGKPSLLKKLYIRGDWSAANGYIDNIKTVAGEREIVRGKNLPNATNIDFHKFAAAYNSITLDYKISDGEMKVQLLDENGNASDIYRFNANGEVTDYAGITTSLRSDGYQKIIFKLSQLTNAPDKIATVRVLADSTGAGYVDNAQFLKTESATYARIGVISDVHLGDDHQGAVDVNRQSQRLERLLTNYKLMGVDGIVVSGDLVDHGTLAEKKAWMEVFAEVWLRVFPNFTNDLTGEPVEPIIIYGNHDTDLVNDAWWPESLGEYKPGYMTNVNGYYFVAAQYMEEYAATDYLAAAREDSGGNPFFYVQHCDFEGLLYNHTNVDHGTGLTAMDDLWNDSNAITLNGHTHFTVTDERSIWQPSDAEDPRFTSISVPSINYGRVADGYTMNGNRNDVVQGLYIVLNGSEVSITRLSFHDETDTDGEQIGAIWSFDAADPNDKPYGYETRANVTNKPVFAADAKITVTAQTSTSATISFPAATVTAPAGFSDMVQGYRVVVLDKTTGEVVSQQIITTAYHIDSNPNRMQSSYQATLSGLTANTNYEIQVYAVEFYQVESDPLTLTMKLS